MVIERKLIYLILRITLHLLSADVECMIAEIKFNDSVNIPSDIPSQRLISSFDENSFHVDYINSLQVKSRFSCMD